MENILKEINGKKAKFVLAYGGLYLTKDRDFPFCPHCSSKKFYFADFECDIGEGGDINHYCLNCKCGMILKCLSN